MHADTRRALVFIVVGILVAVAVGLGVWRASAPAKITVANDSVTAVANTTTTEKPATEPSSTSKSTLRPAPSGRTKPEETTTPPANPPQRVDVDALAQDPFLAPNAVIAEDNGYNQPDPTMVYRPDNVSTSDIEPESDVDVTENTGTPETEPNLADETPAGQTPTPSEEAPTPVQVPETTAPVTPEPGRPGLPQLPEPITRWTSYVPLPFLNQFGQNHAEPQEAVGPAPVPAPQEPVQQPAPAEPATATR